MNKIYYKDIPYKVGGDSTLVEATITERGETSASDFRADGFSKVNVNVPYTDVHYAKDDIVSFEGEDFPLKSLTAYITALQDLHGYDYPWVGGAGKNLFDRDNIRRGVYTNADGTTQSSSATTNFSSQFIKVKPDTVYSITMFGESYENGSLFGVYYDENKNGINQTTTIQNLFSNISKTFTTPSNAHYIVFTGYRSAGIDILTTANTMVCEGTPTSYEPYSNICPISGWSGANVSVSGVNVWDEEWELGGISNTTGQNITNNSTIRTKNYIPVVPNTQYYINSNKWQFVSGYDADKNFVGTVPYVSSGTGYYINVPSNVHYIRIPFSTAYGTTYNNDISINYPSTDTEYHAYNGNTYSLTFTDGSNPLTVYGGTVDLVSGVLTVDKGYVDLGTLDWRHSSIGEIFYARATNLGVKATDVSTPFNAISSALIAKSYNEIDAKTVDYAIGINPNATQLFARYSSITSASDFITAMNGVQLVYELATPLTYQLSKQQIKSLVGVNNIYADTGEVAVEWQTLYQTP